MTITRDPAFDRPPEPERPPSSVRFGSGTALPDRQHRQGHRSRTLDDAVGGPGWWLGEDGRWHPSLQQMLPFCEPKRVMRDGLGGRGWWLAADGHWYPPEHGGPDGVDGGGAPHLKTLDRPPPPGWLLGSPPEASSVRVKEGAGAGTPGIPHRGVRIRLLGLAVLSAIVIWACVQIAVPHRDVFNWYLSAVWSMYFPVAVVGVAGIAHTVLRSRGHIVRSEFKGKVTRKIIFLVPSMCRSDTINALMRVVSSILERAPEYFDDFRIDVVTEEGLPSPELVDRLSRLPSVRIVVVPAAYEPPNGARFKARANHYALERRRAEGESNADTYVYHLDDDTHVGADTVASLAEFITRSHGRHYLAQGILAFPRELTASPFCWLADAIRPGDDITRFSFFTRTLGRPLGGLHGEHVVIRADIEDAIGWDFPDTVIEDAYFGLQFVERFPGRSTTLDSFSYGASPSTVADLVRQRRRWSEGLLRLTFNPRLRRRSKMVLAYCVLCWIAAPLQFVGFMLLLAWLTGIGNTSPVETWIAGIWGFSIAVLIWQYMQGLKVNIAASARRSSYWWRAVLVVPSIFVFSAVESYAALLGIVRFAGIGSQKESEVIAKPI